MANLQTQIICPDISFYQDTANFEQMKQNGALGVIIRAGQNNWPDPKFSQFWNDAKQAGLPRGTYFYYDSRMSPVSQADLFYNQFQHDLPEMEIWCDYEENYGGNYAGWKNFKIFLERLLYRNVPKNKIGIYTGYYYWLSHSPQNDLNELSYFKQYKLWLAWYTENPVYVMIPYPWSENDVLFWQFTSSGNGIAYGVGSKGIDLNYFNGDLAKFQMRYSGGVVDPPTPPQPPTEAKQKGIVIVGGLNVRTGNNIGYSIIDVLVKNDVVFGNVDPITNWMRISRIQRATGIIQTIDGWASALPQYMTVTAIDEPPTNGADKMIKIFSNGVTLIIERRFDSDIETWMIPHSSVYKYQFHYEVGQCKTVESVGGDLVFNLASFNTGTCRPNLGFRMNNQPYYSYQNYNPYLCWSSDFSPIIQHNARQFSNFPNAAQLFRYVIEDGIKNPNASSAWDELEPRRLIGKKPNGDLVIISAAGHQTNQRGLTLHEAAQLGLELGCDFMCDGDSGSSVQALARYSDGSNTLFTGEAILSPVATFLSIVFDAPLENDGGTEPPPTTEIKPVRTEFDLNDGSKWEATAFNKIA